MHIAVVVISLCLLAGVVWYILRPSREEPWNAHAITATFADLTTQPSGNDVHLIFRYNLTNNTKKNFRLPAPTLGALMRKLPDGKLKEVDSAEWESVLIPAGKTVSEEFDLSIDPTRYDLTPEEMRVHQALLSFAAERLQNYRALAFFDYGEHYWIDLPRGWQ